MTRLIAHLIANGLAVVLLARLIPEHVGYTDTAAVVIFAIVLALLNAVLRPILQLVALPITCLTLGIFALVVNAVVFYLAGALIAGIQITFIGALVGSVTESVLSGILWRLFATDGKW
ncbi:phage holin family protein [Sphaerobacter thermophilus]|uniref:Phage holin family protein n=1 Tax=Sphaerobacter thermophilus (strain ATCC 49802 / DSM 20745 / KCCM 41009 / NCIMB 13125 / S 6022) TaxID=479434 RepID=D1C7U2_SPHTD|nr:phage holin family protein [Sphaerobacter thermophilus]ACZ37925.1 membrane protein of unknown function [Sphaerobacter thermophilus DSM 20745]PZN62535.1 MAG: phage holin family protein [Sphaerobacter thermophilus]